MYDVATMRRLLQYEMTKEVHIGPSQRCPGVQYRTCPHAETRIVKLQNHKFWAREECARCGQFLRWPKKPAQYLASALPQLIVAIKAANRPVAIQGSEKQIAWATSIRRTLIARFWY